jgi:hypothetical protein
MRYERLISNLGAGRSHRHYMRCKRELSEHPHSKIYVLYPFQLDDLISLGIQPSQIVMYDELLAR